MSKRRREKAILVTAEEAPFTDGKGDVKKTVLSGSEIDGGEKSLLLAFPFRPFQGGFGS